MRVGGILCVSRRSKRNACFRHAVVISYEFSSEALHDEHGVGANRTTY